MTIFIGADHRGYDLKEQLKTWLKDEGYEVVDCGDDHLDPVDDYVNFSKKVAENVCQNGHSFGIVICGSGIGVSIVTNRYRGVRCALGFDVTQVRHGRENDHINILSIPSNFVNFAKATELITVFLETNEKTEEKYLRRIGKIDQ